MSTANHLARRVHAGDTIDYTPASAVAAGDVVVVDNLVGVAMRDIAANELGHLTVSGVYDVPKATGGAIDAGALVFWDTDNDRVTTTAGNFKCIGICVAGALSADTVCRVLLIPNALAPVPE